MEAQAVAALLPVCMEILGRIAELQTRVADMAQYASAIMSVQTVLENANQNHFVVPSMTENIATSLGALRDDLKQASVMSRCCYMCQAKDCLKRIDRKVILVQLHVSCYNALMMTSQKSGGLTQEERDALTTIRQVMINTLRNVVRPNETANGEIMVSPRLTEISELPNQLHLVWNRVTATQMQRIQESCNVLLPQVQVDPAPTPCLTRMVKVLLLGFFLLALGVAGYKTYPFVFPSEKNYLRQFQHPLSHTEKGRLGLWGCTPAGICYDSR